MLLAVNDGTALGITTGLQFLPGLLLSPYAGLVADRFPKQRLLQVTQTVMAVTALLLGVLAVTGAVEVWHVYVLAFVFGVGLGLRRPGPPELRQRDGRSRRPHQRRRPQLRVLQRRPRRRPGARRPADRRLRRRCRGHRLGDPAQRRSAMPRSSSRCGGWSWPTSTSAPREPRHKGMIRDAVRYLRGRPDLMMILSIVFFAGTFGLNFQMTSALMATQVFHQGATRVRPARLGDGGRFADRRADGCPAHAHPAAPGRRRGAPVRRGRDPGRPRPDVPRLRGDRAVPRLHGADHDHRRQHHHAAGHGARHARDG